MKNQPSRLCRSLFTAFALSALAALPACGFLGGDSKKAEQKDGAPAKTESLSHKVGKTVGEAIGGAMSGTVKGTATGLTEDFRDDKTALQKIRLGKFMTEKGFKVTTADVNSVMEKLTVYIVGPENFDAAEVEFIAKLMNAADDEIGRATKTVQWKADFASSVVFSFGKSQVEDAKWYYVEIVGPSLALSPSQDIYRDKLPPAPAASQDASKPAPATADSAPSADAPAADAPAAN